MSPHPSLHYLDHRPWPLPEGKWVLRQAWCNLLFLHWAISEKDLRHYIPAELEIDLFDGSAWIGVVPFSMEGVMRRHLPNLPYFSAFPELNVRTYVSYQGKPGVWFFSLDAGNRVAVWAGRKFYHLPYYNARFEVSDYNENISYHCKRNSGSEEFIAQYRPITGEKEFPDESFEIWSTERYCLYCQDPEGSIHRAEVHHRKWPLQQAETDIEENTMGGFLPCGEKHPTALFSKRIDVVVWPLKKVSR